MSTSTSNKKQGIPNLWNPYTFTTLITIILFIHNNDSDTFLIWCLTFSSSVVFVCGHMFVCSYMCVHVHLGANIQHWVSSLVIGHLIFLFTFLRSIYLLWVGGGALAIVLLWKLEDNLQEQVLSCYVGCRDLRASGSKSLNPLSHLAISVLRQGLFIGLQLTNQAMLPSLKDPPVSASLAPGSHTGMVFCSRWVYFLWLWGGG